MRVGPHDSHIYRCEPACNDVGRHPAVCKPKLNLCRAFSGKHSLGKVIVLFHAMCLEWAAHACFMIYRLLQNSQSDR